MLDKSGHRGIGRFIYDLLHGLAKTRDDWKPEIAVSALEHLSWTGKVSASDDLEAAADRLRAARGTEAGSIAWKRQLFLPRAARHAAIVHLPEAIGLPSVLPCRSVVTCHDLIPLRMPKEYLGGSKRRLTARRRQELRRYSRACRFVAISEKTRREFIELLGLEPSKFVVVRHGIDLEKWRPAAHPADVDLRRALGIGARPYILYAGYGDARKGIDTMLETLQRARSSLDLELVWAGELPRAHLAEQRAAAARAGVENAVRFVGFVDDARLAALYRGALAHVFLSKLEGFGLSVAEAIACGCPVIVVRGSGADEVGGPAAMVIEPDDATAAADAVVRIASRRADRSRLVALGIEHARQFERSRMALDYVRAWLDVLRRFP